MASLTRANIAYDLNISPHVHEVEYPGYKVKYYFSSSLYLRNFKTRMHDNRKNIAASLSNRFNFAFKSDVLADMKLYITIEKRGFLIEKNSEKIECLSDIILDGNSLTSKS